MSAPYLGVALTGQQVDALLAAPSLLSRWDSLPLAFTVVGIDSVGAAGAPSTTLEPSVATTFLARRAPRSRLLFGAASRRDHPYNLARRVASAGHLARGRTGVLLGTDDPGTRSENPWTDAATSVADIAHAVRELERSWPFDSVVADRKSGILVRSDEIGFVDLDGPYRIAGPLTVPEPTSGPSVIGAYDTAGHRVDIGEDVDLVVGPTGSVQELSPDTEPSTDVVGILLRDDDSSPQTLAAAAENLIAISRPIPPGLSLRAALGLPAAPRVRRRAAFPRPAPLDVS